MINYNKNKLINMTLDKYYETFSHMLDTCDYVPQKYNDKIGKYIFKNMKKSFKMIDKEDKIYQRKFRKSAKLKEKQQKISEKSAKNDNKLQKNDKKKNLFRVIFHKNKAKPDS